MFLLTKSPFIHPQCHMNMYSFQLVRSQNNIISVPVCKMTISWLLVQRIHVSEVVLSLDTVLKVYKPDTSTFLS